MKSAPRVPVRWQYFRNLGQRNLTVLLRNASYKRFPTAQELLTLKSAKTKLWSQRREINESMGAGYKEEAGELVSIAFHHPGPLTLEQVPPILPLAPCICCIINIITLSRLFFGFCCCMFMFACSNTTSKVQEGERGAAIWSARGTQALGAA